MLERLGQTRGVAYTALLALTASLWTVCPCPSETMPETRSASRLDGVHACCATATNPRIGADSCCSVSEDRLAAASVTDIRYGIAPPTPLCEEPTDALVAFVHAVRAMPPLASPPSIHLRI
jgi:hypothetical protein